MIFDVVIPKVGMGITEVEIVQWKVKPGDKINKGDPIVEIDVQKANTDIEAEKKGVVKEVFFEEGEIVEVGNTICSIESE
jgi:pyruvate/2-oxoglutarate dehydrogenase complex dihydrolipoamide acyltransferase (E2) component